MTDVVAFARRERILLAALTAGEPGRTKPGQVPLVAEDGARFLLPEDQIVARWSDLGAPSAGQDEAAWLTSLRLRHERAVAWEAVHGQVAAGSESRLDELAILGALDAEHPEVTTALAATHCEPWFRRKGPLFVAVPREEALAKRAAAEAKARADDEDERFRRWWPRRADSLPPQEMEGALAAVRDFALRGETAATERGRLLLSRFDIAEPDLAVELLVEAGVLPHDVNPAPYRAALADPMSENARAEAHRVADEPMGHLGDRLDLTGLFTVSVDGEDTTEVDDALSVVVVAADSHTDSGAPAGTIDLYVHISDVADAIERGRALDKAASHRMTSIYMPDGAVTMLPSDLIEKRLSLDEGRDRAAVTGIFRIAPDGSLLASEFRRTRIRVTRRLNYAQTADPSVLAATPAEAAALVAAATALRAARVRGGAIVLGMPSLEISAKDGAPHLELRHQDSPGDLVVAEAAVLYNAEAGRRIAAADAAGLFRTQGSPKPEPREGDPLRDLLLRRRFSPTSLRVEPDRHHGVGVDAYAQTTSPMRRFADLVNQRQLLAVIAKEPPPYSHGELEKLAEKVSERERAVRGAADDRTMYWLATALLPRRGTTIEGILSRAPRRGLGGVWVPELLRELPLRAPDTWKPPAEGTPGTWRIERVLPWRGRVELGVV